MQLEQSIEIDAPEEAVWAVMSDVVCWPQWTTSVTSVEPVGDERLQIGAHFRVRQPRVPALTWEVTRVDPGRAFTWTTKGRGFSTIAEHRIEALANGRTRAVLALDQRGIAQILLGWWIARLSRRYLAIEAAGLKRRSESWSDPAVAA